MGDQNKHFPFSASGSKRWINCPGSWQLEKMAPVQPSGDAARVGTAVHAMIEHCLEENMNNASSFAGVTTLLDTSGDFSRWLKPGEKDSNGYTIPITDKMMQDCELCVDLVIKIMDQHPDGELFTEMKTVLIPDKVGGTADVVIIDGDWACVIDYKNGVTHVDIDNNTQLMIYALGILENCKSAGYVRNWTLAIVQPNDFTDSRPVRTCKTSTLELEDYSGYVWRAVSDCEVVPMKSQNPEDYCSGDWCQWCKGSANCPLQKQALLVTANKDLPDLPDFGKEPVAPIAVGELNNEQIAWVMAQGAIVEKYIGNVRKEGLARMERGENLPGFKLVESRTRRAISDPEGLELAAEENGWEIWQKKIGPLSQLDKQVPKVDLARFISKPKGKATWAPDTDKRPEIKNLLDGIDEV